MYLLFPGRHHLLTNFQHEYLSKIIKNGLKREPDIHGVALDLDETVDAIIYAVTSANHSNTRRNPLPFYLRTIALQDFSSDLGVPVYMYGIDDMGRLDDFALYTIKRIKHDSDGLIDITPNNTIVLCSTPVLEMYAKHGFAILPAELANNKTWEYKTALPWEIVSRIALLDDTWKNDPEVKKNMHHASQALWQQYNLASKVQVLFRDNLIGEDGDITETRDYNSYVRQMDEIAGLKYAEVADYIRPGRIGDIGCAVGSWIKSACEDERYRESDFYGIEVARHLYDICKQRKHNGEFSDPYVFFAQKNAVTGLVFESGTMNTIHTSSLTHEIESYGSRDDLISFIKNRYRELTIGGVWINRDVVGPFGKNEIIYMRLARDDGRNDDYAKVIADRNKLKNYLDGLSTYARFLRFAQDFRHKEGFTLAYDTETVNAEQYITLRLRDACEFMSRKDYTDNWLSEMHETFCFWDYEEWQRALIQEGFKIHPGSRIYTNQWIVENRLSGKVVLGKKEKNSITLLDFPVTHMILIAEKISN